MNRLTERPRPSDSGPLSLGSSDVDVRKLLVKRRVLIFSYYSSLQHALPGIRPLEVLPYLPSPELGL